MPKYLKQKDKVSCGPIAILNALRWAGKPFSYEELFPVLDRKCRRGLALGTHPRRFDRILRKEGRDWFTIETIIFPTLRTIIQQAKPKTQTVILNYKSVEKKSGKKKFIRHFAFIEGISNNTKKVRIINAFSKGKALQEIDRKRFQKICFSTHRTDNFHHAWVLTKLEKKAE